MIDALEARCIKQIDQALISAFWRVTDMIISDAELAKLSYEYVRWQIAGGTQQYTNMSMWAATNRDLLELWVLDVVIEQGWDK